MKCLFILLLFETCFAQFDRSPCGSQKGCLFYPPGCSTDCRISFSYLQEQDALNVELSGPVQNQLQYVAVGFSTDGQMGDDSVIFCRYMNGKVQAGIAYNEGHSNRIMENTNIYSVSQAGATNGNLYCSLKHRLNANVANVKNLNGSLYILLATGIPKEDGNLSYHRSDKIAYSSADLREFQRNPNGGVIVSPTAIPPMIVNYAYFSRPLGDWLKIIHGILMTVGWGIFLSTGILYARYFKHHSPNSTICGVKMWFMYHRTLNSIGILCTILGAVAIFWAFNWNWMGPMPGISIEENLSVGPLHSLIGAISCVLCWFQPFNALCRCKPESGARIIFNIIHRCLGLVGFVFAMAAIFLATKGFFLLFFSPPAAIALWIAYLALLIVTIILLEVLSMKRWCTSTNTVQPEKEGEASGSGTMSGFSNAQSYVLLFYFILTLCLLIPFCVGIFFKPVLL